MLFFLLSWLVSYFDERYIKQAEDTKSAEYRQDHKSKEEKEGSEAYFPNLILSFKPPPSTVEIVLGCEIK
jgi:hypothetical protein